VISESLKITAVSCQSTVYTKFGTCPSVNIYIKGNTENTWLKSMSDMKNPMTSTSWAFVLLTDISTVGAQGFTS
jgi:hypothetical protein